MRLLIVVLIGIVACQSTNLSESAITNIDLIVWAFILACCFAAFSALILYLLTTKCSNYEEL